MALAPLPKSLQAPTTRPDPFLPAGADLNPITGQASTFDGMSRSQFFGAAMQPTSTGRVYDELRAPQPLGPDPRSFSNPQGMNFAGPAAPPQRPAAMPMAAPAAPSMMAQQPAPSMPLMPMSRGLAARGATPVGRSSYDPQRMAETAMRRRNDPRLLMQLYGQQRQEMQDQQRLQQGMQMFGMQQQAMQQRDATNFQQQQQIEAARNTAMAGRDATNFQQQQDMEATRRAYDEQKAAQETQQRQQYGLKPLDVPGTPTPYFQDYKGSIFTGQAPAPAPAPLAYSPVQGTNIMLPNDKRLPLMQQQINPGWSVTGQPEKSMVPLDTGKSQKPTRPQVTWQDGVPYGITVNERGETEVRKLTIIDANKDGIDDRQQAAGQQPTSSGSRPTGATAPSGVTFKLKGAPDAPATVTGQLPTANHSSPIDDPVAASLGDAQNAYQKSGYKDDSRLRAHFAANPSEATRLAQQEAAVWQDIKKGGEEQDRIMEQIMQAETSRERALGTSSTLNRIIPGTEMLDWGAKADAWAKANPDEAKMLEAGKSVDFRQSINKDRENMAWAEELGRQQRKAAARQRL